MRSQTPIKQILQNQAEFATYHYNYSNFFAEPISPNMISPWDKSSKKTHFSIQRNNDLRRLSQFRHNFSKQNSSAYRSIMQNQIEAQQNYNKTLDEDKEDLSNSFYLHSIQQKQDSNKCPQSNVKKFSYQKRKINKSYTEQDNIQKYKCKWNQYNEQQVDQNNSKKMFQTLSTLNKKHLNMINHSTQSQKNSIKKSNPNRKKLKTTVVDINENTNFDQKNLVKNKLEFIERNYQTFKQFSDFSKKLNLSQKFQIKNSNKKSKSNHHRRFFNKFYFDFSVFGFKNSKSLHKMDVENKSHLNQTQKIPIDHHFEYSLEVQRNQNNNSKKGIKIRQLPNKLKAKIDNTQIKKNQLKNMRINSNKTQNIQKRRCKTDQKRQQTQTSQEKDIKIEKIIHQGSIVINLNKMLQQQVKPVAALNKMMQSSVYRKLRKTLCF